jgi:RNA recognition motif-containing protein
LGSATVVYERPEDALKAIEEYNNDQLAESVLTVEHDIKALVTGPMLTKAPAKTLREGGWGIPAKR